MHLKEHLIEQRAHDTSIWSTAWCPNNQFLTGSLDESVKLWTEDNSSIKKVHTFIGTTTQSINNLTLKIKRTQPWCKYSRCTQGRGIWSIIQS